METLYKSNCVEIIFDERKKMLTQNWQGGKQTKFPFFKQAIDKTVQFFQLYNIEKLVFNSLAQPVIDNEGTNYANANVPILIENGMKKMAFVIPESGKNKINFESILSSSNSGSVKHFNSFEAAQKWLQE